MNGSTNVLAMAGDISLFGLRAVTDAFRRPFEITQIRRQLADVGSKSLPLIVASGFALGAVLTLHTRGTLVTFGATAWIPTLLANKTLYAASANNVPSFPTASTTFSTRFMMTSFPYLGNSVLWTMSIASS